MDGDEIRRARLERLQGTNPSRSSGKKKVAQTSAPPAPPDSPENLAHSSKVPKHVPASSPQPQPAPPKTPVSPSVQASTVLERIFDVSQLPMTVEPVFEDVDSIIWEAVTTVSHKLEYLAASYSRLKVVARTNPKFKAQLANVEQSILSFTVVCATSDSEEMCHDDFPKWLCSTTEYQFVALVVDTAVSQDLLAELVDPVWSRFNALLNTVGLTQTPWTNILNATDTLLGNKKVAERVSASPLFAVQPEMTPREVASMTWLGPYMSLSPIDGDTAAKSFNGVQDLSFENPMAVQQIENLMPETTLIMNRLFNICDKLVRAGPASRQAVLDYFAAVLNKNHRRLASYHVNPKDINSDGFMANMAYIAVKFCQPFVDFSGCKLDKIDPTYFKFERAYDIDEETKLVAELEQARSILSPKHAEAPNFITQIFFLAVGFLHFGLAGVYQSEIRLKRAKQHYAQQLNQIEAAIARMGSTAVATQALERAKLQSHVVNSLYLALSAVIRNESIMTMFYDFSAFVQLWTLHQAQPTFPAKELDFGNEQPSDIFKAFPEHLVESYVATMSFVGQALPQIARSTSSPLINGLIFYMECPQFIKNPYLKSQMVDVLFYGTLSQRTNFNGEIPGYFVEIFNSDPMCQNYLFHALMKIYVDMELTGRSAQFYEKFHTREVISRVMKTLWENPLYQKRLEQQSQNNEDFFVKFTALLLNDSTYMLDSALSKLQDIHRLQVEVETNPTPPTAQQSEQENEENQTPEQQLVEAEDRAKQYLELSSSCVELLSIFTAKVPAPFTRAEVVDRFASMLNYNLNALVGPKCRELKVKNPEKYNFNPRALLSAIVRVYLNLAHFPDFIDAVARDSESFGVANFGKAASVIAKHVLVGPQEQDLWAGFAANVETAVQEYEDDEEELGDIPDEYLDPLMYTVMKNPVILPSSRTTMDLMHIKSYLLNTPTDPFNRTPLKIEDVIPNEELKLEIQAWLRDARAKAKEAK